MSGNLHTLAKTTPVWSYWALLLGLLLLLVGSGLAYFVISPGNPIFVPEVELTHLDPPVRVLIERMISAVKAKPKSAFDWGKLGEVYWVNEFWSEALTCFKTAEKLAPNDPYWPYFHGVTLGLSNPEASVPFLRKAVDLTGDRPLSVHLRLGRTLMEIGQTEEAERVLNHILTVDPAHAHAHLELARLCSDLGKIKEAYQHLDSIGNHELVRKSESTLRASLDFRNQLPQAEMNRQRAADLPPDPQPHDPYLEETDHYQISRQGRARLVYRYLERNQTIQALTLLQDLVKDYPELDWCWLRLGRVYLQLGRLDEANQAVQNSVKLNPDLVEGQFYLGVLAFQREDYKTAEESFAKAGTLKPDYALAHFNRGECLSRLDRADEAIKAFQLALRSKPHLANAHVRLGQLFAKQHNQEAARQSLLRALSLEPGNSQAKDLLSRLNP